MKEFGETEKKSAENWSSPKVFVNEKRVNRALLRAGPKLLFGDIRNLIYLQ
jgi:hypothetical protein